MKVGDLVWFDAFFHKRKDFVSPSEYALKGIIVKEYFEEDQIHPDLKFEVLIENKVYPAPKDCLVLIYRSEEKI